MTRARSIFPFYGRAALAAVGAISLAWGAAGCQSAKKPRLDITRTVHWKMTASDSERGHGPEMAKDGKTNTWWRSGTAEPQWIEVDMARPAMVCGFSLQWGEPHAAAYSVQTRLDREQWATQCETTNSDGGWDQTSIEPTEARYVRVTVHKGLEGTGAALCALEIKGLADQPQARVNDAGDPEAALLDGNPETVWRWTNGSTAAVRLDLKNAKPVGSIRIDWGPNGFASNVVVEISTDGTNWTSMGRIQAQAGDFDVLMGEEARPAQYVRLSFSGASSKDGFEVSGIALRGEEGAARPWAAYELAAEHAPEGIYPDAFRKRQNYWALAGGPRRGDAEALLDEWGAFAPREHGPTLAPLISSDGEMFSARQAAAVEHRLGGDGAPMPETTWKMPSGLSLRIRAMARSGTRPPKVWVQYELANDSIMVQTGRLCWVVRPVTLPPPWAGGGLSPIFSCRASETGDGWREVRVNGTPLFAVQDANLPFGAAPFDGGDVAEYFLRGETPPMQSAEDDKGLVSAAWWMDFALEPGEKTNRVVVACAQDGGRLRSVVWSENASETVEAAFDREWVDASWIWRGETSRCFPKVARPDAMDCLRAQAGWLLGARSLGGVAAGGDLETLSLRVAALLRAGQTNAARDWIEQVAVGMETNGRVSAVSRSPDAPDPIPETGGGHAAQGQFAFMAMEYYRFTQDIAFLQEIYPELIHALAYLQGLNSGAEDLLPTTGAPPEHSNPTHRYSDHYWALLGWKEGLNAASILARTNDATWAKEQYQALRSAVRQSLREQMDRMDASWIPASAEEDRFDAVSVARMFWPCEETDLVEPHEFQSSLDCFYEEWLVRSQAGGVSSDESLLLVPLASMGRGDYAREVLYGLLDRRTPPGWHLWPDATGSDPRQPGKAGRMPSARAAAAYYIAVRGLAAREGGKRLDLFSGAPAEWLQHGEGFKVYGMPTMFGPLDLTGYWHRERFEVEIGGNARPPEGYRIWWPRQMMPERVLANGSHVKTFDAQGIDLPHDFRGRVEAFFPVSAPWPRDP